MPPLILNFYEVVSYVGNKVKYVLDFGIRFILN